MQRLQVLISAVVLMSGLMCWAPSAHAIDPGTYKVVGTLVKQDGDFWIHIYRRSVDEIQLKVVLPASSKAQRGLLMTIFSNIKRQVVATGRIPQTLKFRKGSIVISTLRSSVRDPLKPSEGDGIWPQR